MSADPRRRIAENPFYLLGLPADCPRVAIEREGHKLLGMLEIGLSAARTYRSPLGVHERTPEAVRAAMAELRDPERRLVHEMWAQLGPDELPDPSYVPDPDGAGDEPALPRVDALAALGWRRP